ncbi:MAG: twin-arginine translocation signal domain-containing protein, partial [Mycobacterium sp.]
MPEINRRGFLIASAGVGAAGLLSTTVAVNWPDLMRAAQDRPLPANTGVLVVVSLYGGNDGINTVIPYADNAYH